MSVVITDTYSPFLAESLIRTCAFDFGQRGEVRNVEVLSEVCTECFHVRIQLWYELLFALWALVQSVQMTSYIN